MLPVSVVDNMVQSAVAGFVAQLSMVVQALCTEVFEQSNTFRFRALVCLQAQTLELNLLQSQLAHRLEECAYLTDRNACLQGLLTEQHDTIASLEQELSAAKADLDGATEKHAQFRVELHQLQQQCDDLSVLSYEQDRSLHLCKREKADMELEIAQLKQSLHMAMDGDVDTMCLPDVSVSGSNSTVSEVTFHGLSYQVVDSLPLPVMSTAINTWVMPSAITTSCLQNR